MGKPIKFRSTNPSVKIVNMCFICRKAIKGRKSLCESCDKLQKIPR